MKIRLFEVVKMESQPRNDIHINFVFRQGVLNFVISEFIEYSLFVVYLINYSIIQSY